MVCPRCFAEHEVDVLKVERSRSAAGKVTAAADIRRVKCLNCDFVWCEESRIALVSVYDPATNAKKLVTVEEYNSVWRARDEASPKKILMFGVHDE